MKWRLRKRISLASIGIVAILAGIVHLLLHVPFWLAFLAAMMGILINGIVATVEDDAPGGLNNPRKDPPSDDS